MLKAGLVPALLGCVFFGSAQANVLTRGSGLGDATASTLVVQMPGSVITDGSWTGRRNGFVANLNASSGNEFLLWLQGGITGPTNAPAAYERAGLLIQMTTADPSQYGPNIQRDLVGIDARGKAVAGNMMGRVWGGVFRAEIASGADGYAVAQEVEPFNYAAVDQSSFDTTTSKYGQMIVSHGTQNTTAASYLNEGPEGGRFHYGYSVKRSTLVNAAGSRAFWLGTPGGTEYFGVDRDGAVNTNSGYKVGGAALAASHLSDGTTGTGTVVLSDSPALTGNIAVGHASPTSRFHIAGTYTSANAALAAIGGTHASSVTSNQYALQVGGTFAPSGGSLTTITGVLASPQINSTALTISNMIGVQGTLTLGAGYSGTVTTGYDFFAANPIVSGGSIASLRQYFAEALTNGNGITSGTTTNRQFHAAGITSSAAGGTLNNRGVDVTVPSGGASAGTATNVGVYITGNGGSASGGSVGNYALFSDSTAPFYVAGKIRAAGTAPALSSCGTSPAIVGDDKAGEVTLGTGSPTGCTITFAVAHSAAPYCVVSWQSNLASMQYAVSVSAITLTQTATSSNKVNYICFARAGG